MTQPKIRALPSEEVQNALLHLWDKYDGALSVEDSDSVFLDCINELGGLFGSVTSDTEPKEWWFFRIRTHTSFLNFQDTLTPQQYSYPPPSEIGGRCHLPGKSVFYCSDSIEGCIAEMKASKEANYFLSIWRLPTQKVRTMKFLCGSNINESSRLFAHKQKIFSDACESQGFSDELNVSRLTSFLTAWSDLFLSGNHSLSACIAHQCMFGSRGEDQDLIAYGSAINGSFMNFAIPPLLADKLVLDCVLHLNVTESNENAIGHLYKLVFNLV